MKAGTEDTNLALKPVMVTGACRHSIIAICTFAFGGCLALHAQGNQRPLAEFLNAQGQTTCFTPPVPAQLGFATGANKTNGNANLTPSRFALIDYTGLEAQYLKSLGIDLGTTVSGTMLERPLANGEALVTVDLHSTNAMGWALQDPVNFNTDPLAFGFRAQDLVANPSIKPAMGNVHFRVEFTIPFPGAPIPDIVAANAGPDCPASLFTVPLSWSDIDFISLQATITGSLHAPAWPEGTTGQLTVTEIGLNNPATHKANPPGPLSDAFPVEAIDLHPIDH